MITWSQLRQRYQDFTKLATTAHVTFGDSMLNYAHQELVEAGNYNFREFVKNITSILDRYYYPLPPSYGQMREVTWVDGTNEYPLDEVVSWKEWNYLRSSSTGSGTPPTHYFVVKGAVGNTSMEIWVWPTPSEASKTLRCTFNKIVPNMSVVDYTTGTITATNGSATIAGSATTVWTSAMVGRSIQLPDGYWYDIIAVGAVNSLTIHTEYQGTTTAGATYTIAEVPLVPENFQDAIWQYAVGMYFAKERQLEDSTYWKTLYEMVATKINNKTKSRTTSQIMHNGVGEGRSRNQYPVGPL